MYFRKEKFWQCFPNHVLAENWTDAICLAHFLKYMEMNKLHIDCFEILDIRRYRLITKKKKVAMMLKLPPSELSFLFPVNKN